MFAVIKLSGKQYLVKEGDKFKTETIKEEEGKEITIKEILLVSNGEETEIGEPLLDKTKVSAKIIKHGKDKKVTIFKYKKRKGYRRKQGHRQNFSEIEITKIISEKIKPKVKKKEVKVDKKSAVKKAVTKKPTSKKSVKK